MLFRSEERDFYVISGDGLSTVSLEEAEKVCEKNPELFIKAQYKVETCTVGQILNEYFPKPPTILSIDIEGMEERILSGIDYAKSSPLVIILENIPYSPLLSIDQREYKCVEFLREKGYTEYAFTGHEVRILREDTHRHTHTHTHTFCIHKKEL